MQASGWRKYLSWLLIYTTACLPVLTAPQAVRAMPYDSATGTYYVHVRNYDPKLGRWMQRDPNGTGLIISYPSTYQGQSPAIGPDINPSGQHIDGLHMYQYVQGNPVNRTDPSGLFTLAQQMAVGGGLAFLAGSLVGGTRTAIDLIGNRDENGLSATEIAALISRNAGLTGLTGAAAVLIGAPIVASGPLGAGIFASLGLGASGAGIAIGKAEIADAQNYSDLALGIFDTATAGLGVFGSAFALRAAMFTYPKAFVSRSQYPASAAHIEQAQRAGQPRVLTIDRTGAEMRRRAALQGHASSSQGDRDEYPPAMFKEGGAGASVRIIPQGDNRGAGSIIGQQLRALPDGTKVTIEVVP